jgi:hypothetical protein
MWGLDMNYQSLSSNPNITLDEHKENPNLNCKSKPAEYKEGTPTTFKASILLYRVIILSYSCCWPLPTSTAVCSELGSIYCSYWTAVNIRFLLTICEKGAEKFWLNWLQWALGFFFFFTVFIIVSFYIQTCLIVTDVFIARQSSAGKSRALHPDFLFSDRLQFDEYYNMPHLFTWSRSTNLTFLDLVNDDTTISSYYSVTKNTL